jgi:hypothetical protein
MTFVWRHPKYYVELKKIREAEKEKENKEKEKEEKEEE